MEIVSECKSFGGVQKTLRHESEATGTPMQVSVFLPPAAESAPVPVLYFLSGLTCTDENVTVKGGAQRFAAEAGIAFVAALISISVMMAWLRRAGFMPFVIYRLLLGGALLAWVYIY